MIREGRPTAGLRFSFELQSVKTVLRMAGLVLATVLTSAIARAQDGEAATVARRSDRTFSLGVRRDSRLWLEGSSNVRDWTCVAKTMDATIEVQPVIDGRNGNAEPPIVRAVSVKVPVRALKCGDRHMEANMYRALKSPPPPAQSFIIAEFSEMPLPVSAGPAEAAGRMTVAGVERSVRMTVIMDQLPDGTRRATGTVPILMTDFGVTPPRPWMGILRAANAVRVRFEIFVTPPAPSGTAGRDFPEIATETGGR